MEAALHHRREARVPSSAANKSLTVAAPFLSLNLGLSLGSVRGQAAGLQTDTAELLLRLTPFIKDGRDYGCPFPSQGQRLLPFHLVT